MESMNLLTERLRIRDLKASDAALLAGIWSDAEVTRYMGGPRDYEETRQDLITEAGEGEADPTDTLWPVVELSSGRVIGDCGFLGKEVDGRAETELIYVFSRKDWGNECRSI